MEKDSEKIDFKNPSILKHETNEAKSKKHQRVDCSVSGTMYLMLRVSRVFGLAPVLFQRRLAGHFVNVSPVLCKFNFVVVTFITIGTFVGLVFDILVPYEKSVRALNPTRWFVWVATFIVMMVQVSISVYRAPRRLEQVIRCLDQINKVAIETSQAKKVSQGQKRRAFVVVFATIAFALVAVDYSKFFRELIEEHMDIQVIVMNSCQYGGLLIIQIMELQFIIIGWEVQSALSTLNDVLEEVGRLVKEQGSSNVMIPNTLVNVVPANSVGNAVDTMAIWKDKSSGFKDSSKSKLHEMIHLLHTKHFQLCGVVRQLDSCFGPELLSVVAFCMMHLISSPNNMIGIINSLDLDLCPLLLELTWFFWYGFCTVAVVEQGHKTQAQMQRTNWLVSDLVLATTDDQVQDELEKFSGYLLLNKIGYTPMGACTLNRDLIIAILGSVTTYLVIIYQFQTS